MLEPVRRQLPPTDKPIALEPRPRPARLRLLQPQHPRRTRASAAPTCHGRVDQMPLMYQDAPLPDGVVPGLPPQPGEVPPAADQVFNMAWQPPRRRPGCGDALVKEYHVHATAHADQLLDLSPVSEERRDASARARTMSRRDGSRRDRCATTRGGPRRAPGRPEARALAQPRRAGRDAGLPGAGCTASSRARPRSGSSRRRRRLRRRFLQLIGASLALAGADRLHQAAARARSSPTSSSPRRSSRAGRSSSPPPSVLGGYALRRPRREPHGPADQDRGQPRPSGEPRRHRRLRPGLGARPLRPRPLAVDHRPRPHPHLGSLRQRGARRSCAPRGAGRRGGAHSDRHRHLADASPTR